MTATWRILHGECVETMYGIRDDHVDAVVCDPPYGLGFMGKDWDSPGGTGDFPMRRTNATNTVNTGATRQGGRQRASDDFLKRQARDARSFQEWCETWGRETLRVLRPGGYLLAFGGTRTYHRLAAGLEDAGFEVRDMIAWLYGSGFPKHPSCLKPAQEPIVVARKAAPKSEPLQIDAARIEGAVPSVPQPDFQQVHGERTRLDAYARNGEMSSAPGGRWPANVAMDVLAADMLDEQSGELPAGVAVNRNREPGTMTSWLGTRASQVGPDVGYGDTGGASRFFYVAKPDQAERNVGLAGRNPHPTVKPVELMRWLCRLVTPPGGTVLDPFTGSGTTGIAAMREGFSFIGIEQDADYVDVARNRIIGDAPLLNMGSEAA